MKTNLELSLFKEITDQSLQGFLLFDNAEQHRAVYANMMGLQILEHTQDAEFSISDLVPKDAKKDAKFKPFSMDIIEHEGLFQNIMIKKSSGTCFIASCGIRKLQIGGKNFTLLMLQDMTLQAKLQREVENKQNQIKLAYEELLQQNQQLKDLDVAKNRFIALVTHELRTPASAVVATAETLKIGLYDTKEELNAFIGMIYEEGQMLLSLINDILDFAKIQAGKMDYYIEEKGVSSLIQKVVETLQKLAESSEVKLHYVDAGDPLNCYFDPLRMNQILTNLMSNGIKYNRKSGEVKVWTEKLENVVRVHIQDNGKGISAENLGRIFNEFETLGKISSHTKGTGLGLPISKKMIESMGGSIGLTSTEGVGSDFWIDIPITKVLGDSEHYRSRAEDGIEDLAA